MCGSPSVAQLAFGSMQCLIAANLVKGPVRGQMLYHCLYSNGFRNLRG